MKQKVMDYVLHHREKTLKYLVAFLFILIALFILLGKNGDEELLIEGRENTSTVEQLAAEESPEENPEPKEIFVHLSGAVNKPGVLKLSEGTRVYEAVEWLEALEPMRIPPGSTWPGPFRMKSGSTSPEKEKS